MGKEEVADTDERGQDEHGHQHHSGRTRDLLTVRPAHLLHLGANFRKELPYIVPHTDRLPSFIYGLTDLQARRDSNPQQAVLETAALPIGATGLKAYFAIGIKTEKNTPSRMVSSFPTGILF